MSESGDRPSSAACRTGKAGLAGSGALHLLGLTAVLLSHPFTPPPRTELLAVTVSLISQPEPEPAPASVPIPPAPAATAMTAASNRLPPSPPKPSQTHKTDPAPVSKPLAAMATADTTPSTPKAQETAVPATTTAPGKETIQAEAGMTAAYLSAIEQTVKTHLIYPAQALRRREQGVVRVRMLVAADGSILSMEEDDQTASPLLVAAALQAVRDAAPFPPLPQGLAEKPVRLVVPVTFALRG